ncbi:MAG: hypothetical protein WB615_04320 [Candidatus Tumulicola sp.]
MNGSVTLASLAAAVVLSGCGGPQPPIVTSGALQQRPASPALRRGYTWMATEAKSEALLYVSNTLFNEVWVFSYPGGHPVGNLTGFALPAGICVNQRTGDIFVSDVLANRIQAYAHGGTSPIRTLPDSKNPQGCSVDPSTGNLAVADYTSQAPGRVAIFRNAKTGPTRYGDPNFDSFSSCGYDGDGNLFADGFKYGSQPGLAELAKGTEKFKDITLDKSIDAIGDIRWDGKYLAVMAGSGNWIYRLAISGSSAKIVGRTSIDTARRDDDFWIQANRVVVTHHPPHSKYPTVGFWHYPTGGQPAKVLSNLPGVQDVGVSLAPQ